MTPGGSAVDAPAPAAVPAARTHHFGVVLLVLGAIVIVGSIGSIHVAQLVVAVLVVVLWLAVARAARLDARSRRLGEAMVLATLVVAVVAAAVDSDGLRAATDLLSAAAIVVIGLVIGRALLRERTVTISTLAGALSLYLLLGLFFAQLYSAAQQISDHAFTMAGGGLLERFELVYFSFITLTTVGYGDIVPGIDATRGLAAAEAVTGQLFLVTIVARVIAMMGHERPSRSRDTRDP